MREPMTEELAMQIATFRFGIIAELVDGTRFEHGEKSSLIRQKASREYTIPGSKRTRLSKAVIQLWLKTYKASGCRIESLKPKRRSDRGVYRGLPAHLCMAVRRLKKEAPRMSVPVMLQKLRQSMEIAENEKVNVSSLYRFIKAEGLSEGTTAEVDRRRFEAEFPNDIWQCDVMHGPLVELDDGRKRKTYLFAIMDDHSRLIVHAEFLLSESYDSLRLCLRKAIEKRGLPRKFYVDNGACYRAADLEQALALLGIALTHSRPYTPEGRGKIERWFRTVRSSFLPVHAAEGLALRSLTARLDAWVEAYNTSTHSSIQTTPEARFRAGIACVRPAPRDLASYFRTIEVRRVKRDRTIRLSGRVFEAPLGLINKSVQVRYHDDKPEDVEVFFEDRSYGFAPLLDVHVNARVGRSYEGSTSPRTKPGAKTDARPEPVAPPVLRSGELFGGPCAPSETEAEGRR